MTLVPQGVPFPCRLLLAGLGQLLGPISHMGHSWQEACAAALTESNTTKLLSRIEAVITAFERRYAEWGIDPGTPAELNAIRKSLSKIERLIRNKLAPYGEASLKEAGEPSDVTQRSLASELGHVRHMFLVLRS